MQLYCQTDATYTSAQRFLILPAKHSSAVSLSPPSTSSRLLHPHHFRLDVFLPLSPPLLSPSCPSCSQRCPARPTAPHPLPPLPVLLCQLFSFRLLTKQGIHIGKMPPKIWPVVTVIIESGVAFPTKCHCCNASPHYRAGRIDHLYDACVVTEPHVDTQTLRMCSPLVLL